MRDFTARALPADRRAAHRGAGRRRCRARRSLEALLRDTQESTSRRIAACGSACAGAVSSTARPVVAAGVSDHGTGPTASGPSGVRHDGSPRAADHRAQHGRHRCSRVAASPGCPA